MWSYPVLEFRWRTRRWKCGVIKTGFEAAPFDHDGRHSGRLEPALDYEPNGIHVLATF